MNQRNTPKKDSSSLIDPSSVMVVGAVDDQGILQSPGSSSSVKKTKKKNSDAKPKAQTSKPPKSGLDKPTKSPCSRSAVNARIDEFDQKWSDKFNRLEALLLARTLAKPEPTFHPVKVTPTHTPPVGVKATKPFIKPTD